MESRSALGKHTPIDQRILMEKSIRRAISRSTLYAVYANGKITAYTSMAEAFHAAQQNGGTPFWTYLGYGGFKEIDRGDLKKKHNAKSKEN